MAGNNKYLINYKALDPQGKLIKEGQIRVKNKMSKMHAQVDLEAYLKKKYYNFGFLVVDSCILDFELDEMLNMFK